MTDIILPQLEQDSTQATIEHLWVQLGDDIRAGQTVALVRTDRFVWAVPATSAGVIAAINVEPGANAAIGVPLVTLHENAPETGLHEMSMAVASTNGAVVRATPLARRMAVLHELDLATISGSGRGGLITRADVLQMIAPQQTTVMAEQDENFVQPEIVQHEAAAIVQKTVQVVPALPAFAIDRFAPVALSAIEVDCSAITKFVTREAARLARRCAALTPTICIARAVVATLHDFKRLNSVWTDDGIIVRGRVQLGIVQNEPGGALRVIAEAGDQNVLGLARALHKSQGDVAPTFAIVEGAAHWSETPLVAGCAATLAIGAIIERPTVVTENGGEIVAVRPLALLALAYDARVSDQREVDAFLGALKQRLERFNAL